MPRYMISFDDGSMDHIPAEALPAVDAATRAVVRAAKDAGVWIFGCGLARQRATLVGVDGAIGDGPAPDVKLALGGFALLEVPSRAEAHAWAARIAEACRCTQEVREILFDPES